MMIETFCTSRGRNSLKTLVKHSPVLTAFWVLELHLARAQRQPLWFQTPSTDMLPNSQLLGLTQASAGLDGS